MANTTPMPTLEEVIKIAQDRAAQYGVPYFVLQTTGMVGGQHSPIACYRVGKWHTNRAKIEEARKNFNWLAVAYPEGWQSF